MDLFVLCVCVCVRVCLCVTVRVFHVVFVPFRRMRYGFNMLHEAIVSLGAHVSRLDCFIRFSQRGSVTICVDSFDRT